MVQDPIARWQCVLMVIIKWPWFVCMLQVSLLVYTSSLQRCHRASQTYVTLYHRPYSIILDCRHLTCRRHLHHVRCFMFYYVNLIHIKYCLFCYFSAINFYHFTSEITDMVGGVGLDQRSCATWDPVSTRMGDRLWTGKPSRYVTSQLGRLSLLPSMGR